MGVLAVAAVVVPVEFVVVAAAALAAAVADLARKAVGTLRKTQVEERCDVAAAVAAVFVVGAAAVVAVVVVSEDMVVAAEHAMSWAWAFFAAHLHLHLQVLRGNYCFGYCSSYGGSAYGTPSSFGDQLGLVHPYPEGLQACPDGVASCWSEACARTCRDASAFVAVAVSVGPSS